MIPPTLYFLLVAFAIALVQETYGARLRNIKLHGFGTGTVNADPLNLDFMGMPVTLGGKGQGDVKGAMEVAIPVSGGLEQYFGDSASDFTNDQGFYGSYPDWMKHHSRYIAGEDVYGIQELGHINPNRVHKHVHGIVLKGGASSRSSSSPPNNLAPLEILNPGGYGGAMYMIPLHTVRN